MENAEKVKDRDILSRLAQNEVHIWKKPTLISLDQVDLYRSVLSREEAAESDRFHFQKDKFQFVIGRGHLRLLLAKYFGCSPVDFKFRFNKYGKPFLAGDRFGLEFNVSYAAGRVVYAFSKGHVVGLDIEQHQSGVNHLQLAETVFSSEERGQMLSMKKGSVVETFYKGWTQKEAFIKALGLGLSYPLQEFTVQLDATKKISTVDHKITFLKSWEMRNVDIDPAFSCSIFLNRFQHLILMEEHSLDSLQS